jgi:nitrite reductase/ring-hydroxylating ferredoxin subunit
MTEHVVAQANDLSEGESIDVLIEGREIGIFIKDGEYYGYLNYCPHQGGPVCDGDLFGTKDATFDRETLEYEEFWTREGEILVCPWHNWEFDLTTGDAVANNGVTLPEYDIKEQDGNIVVEI